MKSYPLVFIGRNSYSFKNPASASQVMSALRLVRRIQSSKLVCIAVTSK